MADTSEESALERKRRLSREAKKRYLARHPEREVARRRARYLELSQDPGHAERNRAKVRAYRERKIAEEDEAYYERERARSRAQHVTRRRRKLEALAGRPRPDHCEICGEPGLMRFDHCHKRGHFRGWICNRCNMLLGMVKDGAASLGKLRSYLEANQ